MRVPKRAPHRALKFVEQLEIADSNEHSKHCDNPGGKTNQAVAVYSQAWEVAIFEDARARLNDNEGDC